MTVASLSWNVDAVPFNFALLVISKLIVSSNGLTLKAANNSFTFPKYKLVISVSSEVPLK